ARAERRPLRVPDRPGGADERPQARARSAGDRAAALAAGRARGRRPRRRPRPARRPTTRPRARARRHARARAPARPPADPPARPRRRLRGEGGAAVTTVLLADDQALVREGFRLILELEGLEVVGEAADGAEAVALARELRPDVALMDVRMPGVDGIEATREIV